MIRDLINITILSIVYMTGRPIDGFASLVDLFTYTGSSAVFNHQLQMEGLDLCINMVLVGTLYLVLKLFRGIYERAKS